MDQSTLVSQQIDAGARFLGEFHKYAPIQTAFWLKDSEESGPWLYVASDQITDDNFNVAYRAVGRIAKSIQDPWFDSFRVKLIGVDDPLAQVALDLQQRFQGRGPVHLRGQRFGSVDADEVYLYPAQVPTPVQ